MNKSYSYYVLFFGMTLAVLYLLQLWVIDMKGFPIRYSILNINTFFAATSLAICVSFQFLKRYEKISVQLAYIYLPTLFIKGGLFFLIFRKSVFTLNNFTTPERLLIIISLVVFLILEVYLISRILNNDMTKI